MKHTEGDFKGFDGTSLYYQVWIPDKEQKAVLLIAHGLGEHSGRYLNVVEYFVPGGYGVYAFDYRGHGKSGGTPGYVNRFTDYVDDLKIFSDFVRMQNPGGKIFLVGHSLGGIVATAYTLSYQKELAGLILSAPLLKMSSNPSALTVAAARLLSFSLPRVGMSEVEASLISQDKSVVEKYISDPLVYHGKICARLGTEILKAMRSLPHELHKITLPVLVMQGTADLLSDPQSSEMFFKEASSQDKTIKLYQGFHHEIFNEPGRLQVFSDMNDWLERH